MKSSKAIMNFSWIKSHSLSKRSKILHSTDELCRSIYIQIEIYNFPDSDVLLLSIIVRNIHFSLTISHNSKPTTLTFYFLHFLWTKTINACVCVWRTMMTQQKYILVANYRQGITSSLNGVVAINYICKEKVPLKVTSFSSEAFEMPLESWCPTWSF